MVVINFTKAVLVDELYNMRAWNALNSSDPERQAIFHIIRNWLANDQNPRKLAGEELTLYKRKNSFKIIRIRLLGSESPEICHNAPCYGNQERNSIPLQVLVVERPPLDLVEFIIQHVNGTVYELANNDRTPLHVACESKASPEVVHLLIREAPDTVHKLRLMVDCLYIFHVSAKLVQK